MEMMSVMFDFVKKEYGIDRWNLCRKIEDNPQIYCVDADGKKYFLKVKKNEFANNRNSRYISTICSSLCEHGVRVPNILQSKNGRYAERYDDFIIEMQEWIDSDRYCGEGSEFESTVKLLSEVVDAMQSCESGITSNERMKNDQYLNNAEFSHEMFDYLLNKYLPEDKELVESACRFLDLIQDDVMSELHEKELQWVHGDFNLKNIGYINHEARVVYDFERIKIGSTAEDTASCMFDLCIKDREQDDIADAVTRFEKALGSYDKISYSTVALLYVICRRMIRHIYRGLEKRAEELEVYDGFQAIFLSGLRKTYGFLRSLVPVEEENGISLQEKELYELLIDISNDEIKDMDRFLRTIKNPEKFDRIFKLCCKHKIMSNLYYHIIHHKLTKQIKKYYMILMNNAMSYSKEKRSLYYEEFSRLNRIFQKEGISYACVKGISVSKRFYGENNNILRDFNDMDFLVPIGELRKVEKILAEQGYGRGFYDYETGQFEPVDRAEIISCRTCAHQIYPFSKPMPNFAFSPVNVFKIDINFSIFFGGRIKDEIEAGEMLEQVRLIENEDCVFPVLLPEYELIQYCYHFYKDTVYTSKDNGLKYVLANLRDIHMMLETSDLVTERFYEMLDQTSVANNIYDVIEDVFCCYGGETARGILRDRMREDLDARRESVIAKIIRID